VDQDYLPVSKEYYHPTDEGYEAKMKERLEKLRQRRKAGPEKKG